MKAINIKTSAKNPRSKHTNPSEPKVTQNVPMPSLLKAKPKFDSSHRRFTSYLRLDLLTKVHELRQDQRISSITALLDCAVDDYLKRHFSN